MRADQLDIYLPTKLTGALEQQRQQFLAIWSAQARMAQSEDAGRRAEAAKGGLLRPVR